jgi:hypothetical protein
MRVARREFFGGAAAFLCGAGSVAGAIRQVTFRPEDFGARGDGITNDSAAFARLGNAVSARGGGTIVLRKTTYLVGAQAPSLAAEWAFAPARLLQIAGCSKAVHIAGNGAVLRCAPGLRYGSFERDSGAPHKPKLPFYDQSLRATPYEAMITVRNCSGGVLIEDLELDGGVSKHRLGGPWGDTGWQIAADGLDLFDNVGDEIVRNVHTHHHARDGLLIDGRDAPACGATRLIQNVRSAYNARQGCSLIGGRDYAFTGCSFSHTGKAGFYSAPGAGIDIEAEGGKKIRDLRFRDCRFEDNSGCGLLADSGDTEGADFVTCTFVGTTSWSAWPKKPRFRFSGSRFVGSAVNCYGDPDPNRAAQFRDCIFTDNPKQAPGGLVYREGRSDGALVDLSDWLNVLFSRCRFEAVGGAVLPWSTGAIYADCTMRQTSRSTGHPRGTYVGRNVITSSGGVDLYNVRVRGSLMVNGKPVTS